MEPSYPTDIRAAIAWYIEADTRYITLQREMNLALMRRVLEIRDAADKECKYGINAETEARLEFSEGFAEVDAAKVECGRRAIWLNYLGVCAKGGGPVVPGDVG